ncbi:MAG: alcohol dehydrogenase catalytic domain-containing protein, partial [Ignavibacteriales bacterium]|nr:alcohol dehydrogenase catalytic domain-containing protein [Ignavibacteriales bacterium]
MNAVVKPKPQLYKAWPHGLQLIEKELPAVMQPDDVQFKVIAGGICGTDVGIYNSKDSLKNNMSGLTTPNVTIGHEFCGRITDAGPKAKLRLAELLIQKSREHRDTKQFINARNASRLAK